jgi:hypothetical protein
MIDYGARPNFNQQQWQSLGAIATGNVHTFSRYRTGADGSSLAPAQRQGRVPAASHSFRIRMTAAGPGGLGDSHKAPAAAVNMTLPPLVPIYGGSNDPAYRV